MNQPAFKIPELDDEALDGLMYAASMAFNAGAYEDAFKIYRGAAAARPSWSRARVGMGASLYCLGRAPEAEAEYRRALTLDAKDQEAHLYLGELVWNERKDAANAETHLQAAFRIQPLNKFGERARFILSNIKREQK
jgi:tetratricopeptide (TPR) repeat protein